MDANSVVVSRRIEVPSPKKMMLRFHKRALSFLVVVRRITHPFRRSRNAGYYSKFRHVYGSPAKKALTYENIKITRNAHDSNYCAVNPKFLAVVVEVGGGGSFLVIPLDRTGRQSHTASKVSGHKRPVLDIKWNPFNDNIIASSSEDCTVKLWYIPDGGLVEELRDHLIELQGHTRRVLLLEWHPTAENILLSAGFDHVILIWNIAKGMVVNSINCHTDNIYSMSFNRNGSLLATTCKDKKLRIIDPRSTEVLRIGDSHTGSKTSKVVYLGDTGRLLTTGFSKSSDRQYAIWSQNDLSQPQKSENIDSSSGVLFPFYDHDTRMVYIAGKGDGIVRYYEIIDEPPWICFLSQFISGAPQRAFGTVPKRGCDTSQCEIFRFYKLHATKDVIEPISMIVPRKSEMFQDDIYPETTAPAPSLSAEEWLSGKNGHPILMSMKSGTKVRTYKPVVYKPNENVIAVSEKNNDKKFMFLSEETKPDYRPLNNRTEIRPSPQMDHRPLGAETYNKKVLLTIDTGSSSKLAKTSRNLGTKFQDVQKKWTASIPNSPLTPTTPTEDIFDQIYKTAPISGSTTVKELKSMFDPSYHGIYLNNQLHGSESDIRKKYI
ncbi:CORO2 [Lepeophtheirus salmonis]|uniref:Coronin n=1 Tax=Lepeophtheirus salmonis TaxID=72036 RepID=A0A7R8CEB1_LEPSM|nr:CORO2 [Lepeophtheirus salmonis]CAF2755951.1 CORO2 [Lepeophtheirus salmonis]